MKSFKHLVREAHRRSVWQVLGVYIAVSWGVYQIIKELTDLFGLPDWVPGFSIILFLIGLPIVLATAIIQEGGPTRSESDPVPVDPPRKHEVLFTWQKAVLGGIAAFLLLGITAGGYMGMRNAGVGPFGSLVASGALGEREPILVAEFAAINADSMLASAVTEAFRVDFAQSASITVVEPAHIRDVLKRMSRESNSRVDADLAHEIAVRDNIKAYVTGEISRVGTRYNIAARLVSTSDRHVLTLHKETAQNEDEIIATVDKLSKKLRGRIGDSFRVIRAERPLEAVSTPSLEALHKYTQAINALDMAMDYENGTALLEEAIELDSTFAMAWRKLATVYTNTRRGRTLEVAATTKAYQYRDRLPDAERYKAEAYYHSNVSEDWLKAINAYRMLEERDPTYPPNNLGIAYQNMRELEKAEAAFQRSIERDSLLSNSYRNLPLVLYDRGKIKEAYAAIDAGEKRFAGMGPVWNYQRALFAAASGEYGQARELLQNVLTETRGNALYQSNTLAALSGVEAAQGRLAAAERVANEYAASEVSRGVTHEALQVELIKVKLDLMARRDPVRALARLNSAVENHPLERFAALDRPYLDVAVAYAMLGSGARAKSYVTAFENAVAPGLRGDPRRTYAIINGGIALNEKRFDAAIAEFRKASEMGPCLICMDGELGLAFEQAGQPDSAIQRYRHYVDTTADDHAREDGLVLGSIYERLADLYAAKGDTNNASTYAGKFVELWANADAELQPRVRAKQEMLRQLGRR